MVFCAYNPSYSGIRDNKIMVWNQTGQSQQDAISTKQARCYGGMSVIPVTQDTVVKRTAVWSHPHSKRPYLKNILNQKGLGVECILSKHKTLNSIPSTAKKRRKKKAN
jgi:hypothetical protein